MERSSRREDQESASAGRGLPPPLGDAIAEAARRARLDPGNVHPEYLDKKPSWFETALAEFNRPSRDDTTDQARDVFSRIAADRRAVFAQALGDARRLATGASVQARCLECAAIGPAGPRVADIRLMDLLLAKIGF